jgi:hypothetical protein
MSRVFSAKLNVITFDYEINGSKSAFEYRSPTTLEIDDEIAQSEATNKEVIALTRKKLRERLTAKGTAISVETLIKDQEYHGNLYEFIGELDKALAEERATKKPR